MFQWTLPINYPWFLTLRLLGWTSNSKSVKWNDLPASSSWCSPFFTSQLSFYPPNLVIPKNRTETKVNSFFPSFVSFITELPTPAVVGTQVVAYQIRFSRAHPPVFCQEIIAVNQAWAGHSGSPFKQAESYVQLDDFNMQIKGVVLPHQSQVGWEVEGKLQPNPGKLLEKVLVWFRYPAKHLHHRLDGPKTHRK